MNLTRLKGVIVQDLAITRRALEMVMDNLVLTLIPLFVFSLFGSFIAPSSPSAAQYLVVGFLFWEFMRSVQYYTSVGAMWNVWFRNLTMMFVTPLTAGEYLTGLAATGLVKAAVVFAVGATVINLVFPTMLTGLDATTVLLALVNLGLFGVAAGVAILGIVFMFGTRLQALSWGLIYLLQPITAALYPLSVLPEPVQWLARLFPTTYVFEAIRWNLDQGTTNWQLLSTAFALNLLYLLGASIIFSMMFRAARKSGQFVKNEA